MHNKYLKRIFGAAAVALLAVAALSGCGCGKRRPVETEPSTEIETEAPTEAETEPETEPETESYDGEFGPNGTVRSYLTGEWKDPAITRRRPVAVMISNVLKAQPTYGVSLADVVVEAPNEASAVRFMALFEDYDNIENIGSIRSARTYHTIMQAEYDAIFFHYGQSNYAIPYLEFGRSVDLVNDVNGVTGASEWAYHSKSGRVSPHHHFTNGEEINYAIERLGYRQEFRKNYEGRFEFVKDNEEPYMPDASDCKRIDVGYISNKPWFEYNEADGLYYRYQFGEAQTDPENDDKQVAVNNIIVQVCDYEHYGNTDYLNIHMTGENVGKYITDGKVIDITWEKKKDWDITHYYDMEGNEIKLNQGKTWIFIVRSSRQKYVSIDGEPIAG